METVIDAGVSLIECMCLLSMNAGLLDVFVSLIEGLLIVARVGGGHMSGFMASTTTFWSGSEVLSERVSPGITMCLVLRESNGY